MRWKFTGLTWVRTLPACWLFEVASLSMQARTIERVRTLPACWLFEVASLSMQARTIERVRTLPACWLFEVASYLCRRGPSREYARFQRAGFFEVARWNDHGHVQVRGCGRRGWKRAYLGPQRAGARWKRAYPGWFKTPSPKKNASAYGIAISVMLE